MSFQEAHFRVERVKCFANFKRNISFSVEYKTTGHIFWYYSFKDTVCFNTPEYFRSTRQAWCTFKNMPERLLTRGIRAQSRRIFQVCAGYCARLEYSRTRTRHHDHVYSRILWLLRTVKNRSAMRTCVAYEIELLFSVWCLIGFLLEELISDYH